MDQWTVGSCFLLKVLNFKFDQFQVLNQNIETRKLKQLLIRQLSWGCFSAGPTQPCWALHISDSTFYTKPGPVQSATCSYGFTFFGMVLYCWVCICGGSDVKSVGIRVVVPWWTLTVDFHPPPHLKLIPTFKLKFWNLYFNSLRCIFPLSLNLANYCILLDNGWSNMIT